MRFLTGRAVNLTHVFLDDDGETIAVPSVSVNVTNSSGTTVATGDAVDASGSWTFNAGALAQGVYSAVFNGGGIADTVSFEVVGAFLFSVADARASDVDLKDAARFPSAELRDYREVVEAEAEAITGRSFVPRTVAVAVETDGTGTVNVGLLDCAALVALSGPDGALDVSLYRLDPHGFLEGLDAFPVGTRLTAVVDYGLRQVPPDVKRAGLVRLRALLAAERSGVPDRAVSFVAADGGNFTLATPGRGGSQTGIPDVDATYARYTLSLARDILGIG